MPFLLLKFTVKLIFMKILKVYFLQDTIENMYLSVYLWVCVRVHWCVCVRVGVCGCEFYEKCIFSVSFRAIIPTVYILPMTNPKITIIQRRLATMS